MQRLLVMICYGVSSKEAIALRKAGVSRTMAQPLSNTLKKELGDNIQNKSNTEILNWVKELDVKEWEKINPKQKIISGKDYKNVWIKLMGV